MVLRDLWFYEIVPAMKKGKKPESRTESQDMPTRRAKIYGDHDIKDKITRFFVPIWLIDVIHWRSVLKAYVSILGL